ncbi:MAG: hypothetical protein RMK50_02640 [Nitrososphaerota archaeon]|nr:hypothetical protein [Candidatus Bathyarchaeota archaeon]MDW8193708.1 hypothetical protein [Nitrososphaerota archaeon]
MSEEAEEIKRLLAFKKRMEKRIEKLQSELKETQLMLETLNSILLSKGFKRAEIVKQPAAKEAPTEEAKPPTAPPEGFKEIIPLRLPDGEEIAKIYVGEKHMRVVLDQKIALNVNTPPFNQFLIERVFAKMQEKDNDLLKAGKLKPDEVFSYSIIVDGDVLKEISIRNFDAERLRDLKSSIKWTLEKMCEKHG